MALLPISDALALILEATPVLDPTETDLTDAAGRVLAADVLADADLPPFTRSAMDGFALRSADAARVPVELEVIEDVMAGQVPSRSIEKGQATRIMTGAPIPAGADAVVMVERTAPAGSGRVRIAETATRGQNIVGQGTDARAGDVLLPAGTRLGPAAIGVAASVGQARLHVRRRPRAVFLSTGDELVPVEARPGPGQIRNSNASTFAAQLAAAGGLLERSEIVPDTIEGTRSAIRRGLSADLLVLSGGVSMGEADHVATALADEGVEIVFHKVALKPGKPLLFGRRERCLVFGLPGNPVSSFMTFLLFVAPALRRMIGRDDCQPRHVLALLGGSRSLGRRDRTQYLPAAVAEGVATPLDWHGSGDLRGIALAGGFVCLPAGQGAIEPGDAVQVLVDDLQIAPVGDAP